MIKKFISMCLVLLILCSCSEMPDNSTSLETTSEFVFSMPSERVISEEQGPLQQVDDYVFTINEELDFKIENLKEYTGKSYSNYTNTPLQAIKIKNQIIFQLYYYEWNSSVYSYDITTKKLKLIEKFDRKTLQGIFKLNENEFILIYTENVTDDSTEKPVSKYHKYNINNLSDYETVDFENYEISKASNDEDKFYYYCCGITISLDKNENKKVAATKDESILNNNRYYRIDNQLFVSDFNYKNQQEIYKLNDKSLDVILADNDKIFIEPYIYYDVKQKKGFTVNHLKKYCEDENFTSLSICNNKYVFTFTKTMIITDKNFNVLKEIKPGNCIGPPVVIEDKLYFETTEHPNARDLEFEKPDYYYLDIDDYKITKIYQSES